MRLTRPKKFGVSDRIKGIKGGQTYQMEAELRGPESCNRNEQHEVRRDLPGQVLERERHRVLIALIFPAVV